MLVRDTDMLPIYTIIRGNFRPRAKRTDESNVNSPQAPIYKQVGLLQHLETVGLCFKFYIVSSSGNQFHS